MKSTFPPIMMNRRQRSQITPLSQSPSTDMFFFKLKDLASRHEKMKIAYHELKSHVNAGLLEAEEVFASLAIPLMKLVGLKTKEMAEEGRSATIISDIGFSHENRKNGLENAAPDAATEGEREYHISGPEGESYVTKATMAGKELMVKQHTNLLQLVQLLRQTEIRVNHRQNDILETLGSHRASLHKFFQKAFYHISTLHSQNHDIILVTVKLLQHVFNNVNAVLSSVEGGVEDLVQDLASKMCNPMVEYVKGLKDDMKNGTCVRLLTIVEEMEIVMRDGKRELEDARKKVRVAEKGKTEALSKLKLIEDRVRRMKEHLSLPQAERGLIEPLTPHKLLGMEEEQVKDEKLLWKLLKKKRKYQASPMGPEGLLCFDSYDRHGKSAGAKPPLDHRRAKRNCPRELVPQTPCLNTWIALGSSPSLAIQPANSRKRVTP
ncbi:uncharacterized protein LOC8275485 [Ricinus communis]|uniref:uncharacterized protein LOC8275485 n=1 Tax=Ricinus communis TaxID=3988 RepID=UPI00201B25A1|nr:uncharacterized protein LOC8275485 [Ricinus communis]XP_048228577.1 uncharacterized protein LOC8275485 [Ricinus communis]